MGSTTQCSGDDGQGGASYGNNTTYKITNNVVDPCIKAAVDQALDADFKDEITDLVWDAFWESEDFNIEIKDVGDLDDSVDGETWAMPQGEDGLLFDIELNADILKNSSKEYITATVFHELLHAYLGYLDIDAHLDDDDHDTMASDYLDRLSESLVERYNISETEATHLSWGGLGETSSWEELSTTEKNQIISTNQLHREGSSGSPCN